MKAVQPVIPVLLGIILIEAALGIVGAVMGIQMASRDVPSFLIGIVFSAYFAGFLAGSLTCERLINRVGHIRAKPSPVLRWPGAVIDRTRRCSAFGLLAPTLLRGCRRQSPSSLGPGGM